MNKIVYVGPTILGVATRNTVYDEIPASLQTAIQTAPYMAGLCVPVSGLATAMAQIRNRSGAYFNLYQKALTYSAYPKGEN
jgi:cytochrome c biogenesis protein CcdA